MLHYITYTCISTTFRRAVQARIGFRVIIMLRWTFCLFFCCGFNTLKLQIPHTCDFKRFLNTYLHAPGEVTLDHCDMSLATDKSMVSCFVASFSVFLKLFILCFQLLPVNFCHLCEIGSIELLCCLYCTCF